MSDTDPLLAAVEPKVGTYEREETLDQWIGVLPSGVEYYATDTLAGLYEREIVHRQDVAEVDEWLSEHGATSKVPPPPLFSEVVHRIIHTKTVTTTTRTETRQPRAEETR